jgi:hypothetical protein
MKCIGGGDVGVAECHHVGRLPWDDAERLDEDRRRGRLFAVEQLVEQGGGLVADALRVLLDTGERRVA